MEWKAPAEVVMYLLEQFPEGTKVKDDVKFLPLHFAIRSGFSDDVVLAVLEKYPDGAKEVGQHGLLPLHWAVTKQHWPPEKQASEKVVSKLLELFPEGTKVKDDNGNLPMQLAMEQQQYTANATGAVVRLLDKADPTFRKAQEIGPLHWALMSNAPIEEVVALLEKMPGAAEETSVYIGYGKLPLHTACTYQASKAVVNALINKHFDGTSQKDHVPPLWIPAPASLCSL